MFEVLDVVLRPSLSGIADVYVKFHDIVIMCELCVYKDEKLWIRMPELWMRHNIKKRMVFFEDVAKSDEFQEFILNKVTEMIGLTLETGIQMRKDFYKRKKMLTQQKNRLTVNEKSPEA